jgi:hypothetical protein
VVALARRPPYLVLVAVDVQHGQNLAVVGHQGLANQRAALQVRVSWGGGGDGGQGKACQTHTHTHTHTPTASARTGPRACAGGAHGQWPMHAQRRTKRGPASHGTPLAPLNTVQRRPSLTRDKLLKDLEHQRHDIYSPATNQRRARGAKDRIITQHHGTGDRRAQHPGPLHRRTQPQRWSAHRDTPACAHTQTMGRGGTTTTTAFTRKNARVCVRVCGWLGGGGCTRTRRTPGVQGVLDGDDELWDDGKDLGAAVVKHVVHTLPGQEPVRLLLLPQAVEEQGQVVVKVQFGDLHLRACAYTGRKHTHIHTYTREPTSHNTQTHSTHAPKQAANPSGSTHRTQGAHTEAARTDTGCTRQPARAKTRPQQRCPMRHAPSTRACCERHGGQSRTEGRPAHKSDAAPCWAGCAGASWRPPGGAMTRSPC